MLKIKMANRENAMRRKRPAGFTLLELMIVVVVIAVLASLAYFNYSRYAFRARRSDGQSLLQNLAAAEERYYTNFNNYTTSITGAAPTGLGFSSVTSPKGYYTAAAFVASANQTYTLIATPVGPQASDQCGALSLTNTGQQIPGPTAMPQNSNGNCW
ncbi:MAG: prepilin-type N-terminal cleavage/methylation domain-containing protein [Xanthomonadaceae bacterium]|nr:prepilin-type N-terminal cleavage/methylation domain-containing protein [Xanthomonadaceae bacterium]